MLVVDMVFGESFSGKYEVYYIYNLGSTVSYWASYMAFCREFPPCAIPIAARKENYVSLYRYGRHNVLIMSRKIVCVPP